MIRIEEIGGVLQPAQIPWFDEIQIHVNQDGTGWAGITAIPQFFHDVGNDVIAYYLQWVFWVFSHAI